MDPARATEASFTLSDDVSGLLRCGSDAATLRGAARASDPMRRPVGARIDVAWPAALGGTAPTAAEWAEAALEIPGAERDARVFPIAPATPIQTERAMRVLRFGARAGRSAVCVFAPAVAQLTAALTATAPATTAAPATPPGDDAFHALRWSGDGQCLTVERDATDVHLWLRRPATTQRVGAWPVVVASRPLPAP
ncbi:MAG: hypothetical protein U0324_46900 [Polyangiales bacterium]